MMKTKLFFITFFLLTIAFAQNVQKHEVNAKIEMSTRVEDTSVPLNQEVIYHIDLSWMGELGRYKILEVGEPAISNLEIRSSGSSNRILSDEQSKTKSVKRITYYFTPLELGMSYIDGITIKYEDTESGSKETLLAQRLSVKITEPIETSENGSNIAKWVLIVIALLFLATVVFFILRYFQRKKENEFEAEQTISLEKKYIDKLKSDIDASTQNTSEAILNLSTLLKEYLKKKTNYDGTLSQETLQDFLKAEELSAELQDKILSFFKKSELSKFAGDSVSNAELHLFFDSIEKLLEEVDKKNDQN